MCELVGDSLQSVPSKAMNVRLEMQLMSRELLRCAS
jgi:hypothetical protein